MLAHSEIIVGTPDNHLVTSLLKITRCAWEATGTPIEFGEDTVASFALKISQLLKEEALVRHGIFRRTHVRDDHRFFHPGLISSCTATHRFLALLTTLLRRGLPPPHAKLTRRAAVITVTIPSKRESGMAGLLLRKDSSAGPGGGPAACGTRRRGSRSGCAYSCVLLIALLASAWIR